MNDFLFNEFQKVTAQAWKAKIQVDLKGADYNDTLLWKTNSGITVKPFYTKEDRTNQKIKLPSKGFSICQSIAVEKEEEANRLALDALQRGANSIEFIVSKKFNSEILTAGLKETNVYFQFQFFSEDFMKELLGLLPSKNFYFNIDIIGNLAKTGNWFKNLQSDFASTQSLKKLHPNSICVNGALYQNAGANIPQQLAYTLAHANEYLNHLGKDSAKNIHITLAVGSNYFFEIAKLRAIRLLWEALLQEYDIQNQPALHVFVTPSLRNKTLYDYNVNMLRTTSECMSAVIGGCDTVANVPYDRLFHKPNEFGERIARNQLLILQKEAELSQTQHTADGAYYIEAITQQIANKALDIFKQIENGGGFLNQLKEGTIQRKIDEAAKKEQEQFDKGELILLGTNSIQNEKDRMKNDLQVSPFLTMRNEKTLLRPIIQKRLAESLEKERLDNE